MDRGRQGSLAEGVRFLRYKGNRKLCIVANEQDTRNFMLVVENLSLSAGGWRGPRAFLLQQLLPKSKLAETALTYEFSAPTDSKDRFRV